MEKINVVSDFVSNNFISFFLVPIKGHGYHIGRLYYKLKKGLGADVLEEMIVPLL